MTNIDCTSCETIKRDNIKLVTDGFTDTMCASFKNDTGLSTSNGRNDCEDLDLMNDCLIGNLSSDVEKADPCTVKDLLGKALNNIWTMYKAFTCAVCGIWTNIHDLWTTVRSFCITKSGNKIKLTSNLGVHCEVTDEDTTYTLTKSGNTITLTGSDGTTNNVTDSNTTYTLTKNGDKIILTGSDGTTNQVTDTDTNTTYSMSINGHTITLTPSSGTAQSVTVPDNNTTYTLSISGHTITLTPSSGNAQSITIPDNDTTYGLSRSGHTVTIVEGGTNKSVTLPDDDTKYGLSISDHTVSIVEGGSTSQVTIPDNDHTRIGVTLINIKVNGGLAGNPTSGSVTGEKTITSSTTRNSISGFEIWNENSDTILNPPSGISTYRMFGIVGYSSDHYQVISAGTYVEINNQTITFQFVNTSTNAVTDDIVIQLHVAWYRPDNSN